MGWTAPPDEVPTTSSWHIDAVAGAVHPITVVQIGDSPLFLADEIPQHGVLGPKARNGSSVTIHLSVENADAALERAVAAGAEITMPIWDTPWGDRYGQFRDPFGHSWSVASHFRDVTPEQLQEAMQTKGG